MRKSEKIVLAMIVLGFLVGIFFYDQFPDQVASHWGSGGQVDGYMSKFWGTFLMPVMLTFMLGMFMLIPKIDPLKANVAKFRQHFDNFVILISAFMFYIYLLTVVWNLGTEFNMSRMLMPSFAILFYYIGILLEHAKRNWFIGIRTPWTLSSDKVWDKTHKRGAKLFKAVALLALVGAVFPLYMMQVVVFPMLFIALYLVVYSYFEYQKEKKK